MFGMSLKTFGVLMIVVSAIGYGLQPVLGKLAYAEGVSPSALAFGRFAAASRSSLQRIRSPNTTRQPLPVSTGAEGANGAHP